MSISTAHVQIYAKTGMQGCAKNNKMDRMFSLYGKVPIYILYVTVSMSVITTL